MVAASPPSPPTPPTPPAATGLAGSSTGLLPAAAPDAAWVLDLDGVVWLAPDPIPGAGDAVRLLREAGARVLFASNNSSPTVEDLLQRLGLAGIPATRDDVVTSGEAAASMLEPGAAALVVGDDGLMEALAARGVRATRAVSLPGAGGAPAGAVDAVDAVVVGYTTRFDYEALSRASGAARAGARLIGTNEDATMPSPAGPVPGAGSILAAVATASGVTPEIAGKPHAPFAALISARVGRVAAVVGDRPSTDGGLARRLGVPFALVLTGVTTRPTEALDPAPAFVGEDLLAVARAATRRTELRRAEPSCDAPNRAATRRTEP